MILDLHRQGLTVSEISRRSGLDRKTVRRYIERVGAADLWATVTAADARVETAMAKWDEPEQKSSAKIIY